MANVYIPVERLIEVVGLPAALKFAESFGGMSVYFPHPENLRPGNAIVAAIGIDAARKCAVEWKQLDVMMPRCCDQLRRRRDRALRVDGQRMSARRLARKYMLTERQVYRILALADEAEETDVRDAAQQKLF